MPKTENTPAMADTGAEGDAEDLLAGAFDDVLGTEEEDDEAADGGEDTGPDEETLGEPDGEESEQDEVDEDDADAKPTAKRPSLKDDDPVFTVEEDGTERPITVAEAKAGYMRTRDYTQKRMKEAEIAKAAEQAKEVYGELVGRYQEYLEKLESGAPSPEALAKLKAEDPEAYLLQMEEIRERRAELEAAKAEKARLAKEQQEKDQAAFGEHLAAESVKLYNKLPHWKDEKIALREKTAIRTLLKSEGFTDEQIAGGMTDHRLVLLIRDAGLYRQGKARIDKGPRPKAGTSLRPGTTTSQPAGKKGKLVRATNRLRQTGSVEDAAAAFEEMPGLL